VKCAWSLEHIVTYRHILPCPGAPGLVEEAATGKQEAAHRGDIFIPGRHGGHGHCSCLQCRSARPTPSRARDPDCADSAGRVRPCRGDPTSFGKVLWRCMLLCAGYALHTCLTRYIFLPLYALPSGLDILHPSSVFRCCQKGMAILFLQLVDHLGTFHRLNKAVRYAARIISCWLFISIELCNTTSLEHIRCLVSRSTC
jgi:hypothetical protein